MLRCVTMLIRNLGLFFLLAVCACLSGLPPAHAEGETPSLLEKRLEDPEIAESLKNARAQTSKSLSGGVFFAPEVHHQLQSILARFQKTSLVSPDLLFDVYLSSTPSVAVWIKSYSLEGIPDSQALKAYGLIVSKGVLDLLSNEQNLKKYGVEDVQKIVENSEGLLAAVIAHELGHIGNTSSLGQITAELDADEFAVRLLAEAGYNPHCMSDWLSVLDRIQSVKHLEDLLRSVLDSHPKPRFRMAHLAELTQDFANSHRARIDLDAEDETSLEWRRKSLRRSKIESPSRASADGIRKQLKSPDFKDRDLRQKLSFIDQYLVVHRSQDTDRNSRAGVLLAKEYLSLIRACDSLDCLNQVLQSFNRFTESAKSNR